MAVNALLLLGGCGDPLCRRECKATQEQLERDFAAANVNCDDEMWAIDDCAQCNALFRRDYGVTPSVDNCPADPFLEPVN